MIPNKHRVKTYFDAALIRDLAEANEITLGVDGRAHGLERYIRKCFYGDTRGKK